MMKIFSTIVSIIFIYILHISFVKAADKNCINISNELVDKEWLKESPIKKPGHYCISGDVYIKRGDWIFSEGREYKSNGATVLKLSSSNISIDFGGHTLDSQLGGLPVVDIVDWSSHDVSSYITLRNGTLISRTNHGFTVISGHMGIKPPSWEWGINQYASDLIDFGGYRKEYFELAHKNLVNLNKTLDVIRDNFPSTNYLIENLKISAGTVGIGIKGGKNVVRNSTIIVDGKINAKAGIYLFGPNQLIENNIIIFKGRINISGSSAAPIKIHAADGTIIRNNTIIIDSSGEDVPQAAISIFDSKNVVIENNKIFGTKSVYKIWDDEDKGSSVIESGSTFPSFWKKPRPSF